jgi:hypothetical protein
MKRARRVQAEAATEAACAVRWFAEEEQDMAVRVELYRIAANLDRRSRRLRNRGRRRS